MGYYSVDLRKKAMELLAECGNKSLVARTFDIGYSTVARWEQRNEQGKLAADKNTIRRPKKIDPEKLRSIVKNEPDITLMQIAEHFGCSDVAVLLRLRSLKITYKKSLSLQRTGRRQAGRVSQRHSVDIA